MSADLIKTWPAFVAPKTVSEIFASDRPPFCRYYFSLGRGKPKIEPSRLWFTYRGRILGSFLIDEIVRNDGSLPKLRKLSGEEGEWQIRPDAWVAVCEPPCRRLEERLFMAGFRGWRYFDVDAYRNSPESRMRT